jgi:hypothetical protein
VSARSSPGQMEQKDLSLDGAVVNARASPHLLLLFLPITLFEGFRSVRNYGSLPSVSFGDDSVREDLQGRHGLPSALNTQRDQRRQRRKAR